MQQQHRQHQQQLAALLAAAEMHRADLMLLMKAALQALSIQALYIQVAEGASFKRLRAHAQAADVMPLVPQIQPSNACVQVNARRLAQSKASAPTQNTPAAVDFAALHM
jgi:hypothetical protein